MYAVGVLFCVVFLRERNSKRKSQGPPSPRERGRGRAKARTNTARKLTHRRCVLRVADRAKQTRSRAKSRSRRRSKARSTSTEEQRTKQHDIIEAQHDSEAKHDVVEARRQAKHDVSHAHAYLLLNCKLLAKSFFFFFLGPRCLNISASRGL